MSWDSQPWLDGDFQAPNAWIDATFMDHIRDPAIIIASAVCAGEAIASIDFGGIYFLLDDDIILYVGISCDVSSRLVQHQRTKAFSKVYAFEFPSLYAGHVEEFYIAAINPAMNDRMRPITMSAAANALDGVLAGEIWKGWVPYRWEIRRSSPFSAGAEYVLTGGGYSTARASR
jgi:hypothetical protein